MSATMPGINNLKTSKFFCFYMNINNISRWNQGSASHMWCVCGFIFKESFFHIEAEQTGC